MWKNYRGRFVLCFRDLNLFTSHHPLRLCSSQFITRLFFGWNEPNWRVNSCWLTWFNSHSGCVWSHTNAFSICKQHERFFVPNLKCVKCMYVCGSTIECKHSTVRQPIYPTMQCSPDKNKASQTIKAAVAEPVSVINIFKLAHRWHGYHSTDVFRKWCDTHWARCVRRKTPLFLLTLYRYHTPDAAQSFCHIHANCSAAEAASLHSASEAQEQHHSPVLLTSTEQNHSPDF